MGPSLPQTKQEGSSGMVGGRWKLEESESEGEWRRKYLEAADLRRWRKPKRKRREVKKNWRRE